MRKNTQYLWLFAAIIILVLLGLFWGCSKNPASSPDERTIDPILIDSILEEIASYPPMTDDGPQLSGASGTWGPKDDDDTSFYEDSNWIYRDSGGTVTLDDDLGDPSYFYVPPYAIPADTTITIRTWEIESGDLNIHEFHFDPEGLPFDPNATFVLDGELFADDEDNVPTAIVWVYFNPATGQWDLESVIPISGDGEFHVPICHFSIYRAGALFLPTDGGLSPGGQ